MLNFLGPCTIYSSNRYIYISSMYHLGWIYGYKGCLICNVYCKISQKAFKSNKHYIPSKFSPRFDIHDFNLWIHFWNASRDVDICWPLMNWMMTEPRDCQDQIQLQKRKKSRRWLDLERLWQNGNLLRLQKVLHKLGFMCWRIIMKYENMPKSWHWVSFI